MKTLIDIFFKMVTVVAPLFLAKQWGSSKTKKEQAEKTAEERNEDAKISSKPFVNKPFSRMRRKKD